MRRMMLIVALAAVVIAISVACASAQETKPETNKTPLTKNVIPPKPPEGTVPVGEEILVSFVDETSRHFDEAREAFMKKDYQDAAHEITMASRFVKLEMSRSKGESEKMLADVVARLVLLADDVRKGSVTSVDKLDEAFAQTEQALAYHHEVKAKEYWKGEDQKRAGQDLKAASLHLEHSMKYGGREAEAKADTIISDARDLSEKMARGTALAADKVGKAMQALGRKIEEAGKKMWPPKK